MCCMLYEDQNVWTQDTLYRDQNVLIWCKLYDYLNVFRGTGMCLHGARCLSTGMCSHGELCLTLVQVWNKYLYTEKIGKFISKKIKKSYNSPFRQCHWRTPEHRYTALANCDMKNHICRTMAHNLKKKNNRMTTPTMHHSTYTAISIPELFCLEKLRSNPFPPLNTLYL